MLIETTLKKILLSKQRQNKQITSVLSLMVFDGKDNHVKVTIPFHSTYVTSGVARTQGRDQVTHAEAFSA